MERYYKARQADELLKFPYQEFAGLQMNMYLKTKYTMGITYRKIIVQKIGKKVVLSYTCSVHAHTRIIGIRNTKIHTKVSILHCIWDRDRAALDFNYPTGTFKVDLNLVN